MENESATTKNHVKIPESEIPDSEWKMCRVCGDKATGYHFNAMTCEGCKGFFRRSVKGGKRFACAFAKNCEISRVNRRSCSFCRWEKCLAVGMKRECIMSDNEIKEKRKVIEKNKLRRAVLSQPALEKDELDLVSSVVGAYLDAFVHLPVLPHKFRIIRRQQSLEKFPWASDCLIEDNSMNQILFRLLPTPPKHRSVIKIATNNGRIADARISLVDEEIGSLLNSQYNGLKSALLEDYLQIIDFSTRIQSLEKVHQVDQHILLRGCLLEIFILKMNTRFNAADESFLFMDKKFKLKADYILTPEIIDSYLNFHQKLFRLQLRKEETALLFALCLFSDDRRDLVESETVEEIQHQLAVAFENFFKCKKNARIRSQLIPTLISVITNLRQLKIRLLHQSFKLDQENSSNSDSSLSGSIASSP